MPIIVCTAVDETDIKIDVENMEIFLYVKKPVNDEGLQQILGFLNNKIAI